MISRQTGLWLLAFVLIPSLCQAQVSRIGQAPDRSHNAQAGCVGCEAHHDGYHGHYGGLVWGSQCYHGCSTSPPLFPPCPNPCRTTLLGELVMGTRECLDRVMSHACCLLSPCCYCSPYASDDCSWDEYDGRWDEYDGAVIEGEPIPVSPQVEPDPFTDDPETGSGARSTMRSIMPAPQGSAKASKRNGVRRVSHNEPLRSLPKRRVTATAEKPQSGQRSKAPRKLRYLNMASPIQVSPSQRSLRFRD